MSETRLEFSSPAWDPPPRRGPRDIAARDGDKLTLGDTTVALYVTPGHTLGTLSPVFEVRQGARKHRALLWGGTAFNFGNDVPRMQKYVDATERMRDLARSQGVDVMLSNHPSCDGIVTKLVPAGERRSEPNRFVIGTPAVQRSLAVMNACAQAQRDRYVLAGTAK